MNSRTTEKKQLALYLFRHAETDYNADQSKIGGRSNHLGLSPRGEMQPMALAHRLLEDNVRLDLVYASPAERALRTMEPVLRIMRYTQEPIISPELQELSQGDWEGQSRKLFFTQSTRLLMKQEPLTFRAPNGESQGDVRERMMGFVDTQLFPRLEEMGDITVGVFGHGFAFKALLSTILDSDPSLTYRICIDNCSITQLKYTRGGSYQGWDIIRVNDVGHLSEVGYQPSEVRD